MRWKTGSTFLTRRSSTRTARASSFGRALRDFARREEIVVATKFPRRSAAEIEAGVTGQQHVQRMLDQSLQNLGMDYVDLYICHMWDYATPIEEILDSAMR